MDNQKISQNTSTGPKSPSTQLKLVDVNAEKANFLYFIAKMSDQGIIDDYNSRAQFIIPINSELRIQLDSGTEISRNAKLLVNKPQK